MLKITMNQMTYPPNPEQNVPILKALGLCHICSKEGLGDYIILPQSKIQKKTKAIKWIKR